VSFVFDLKVDGLTWQQAAEIEAACSKPDHWPVKARGCVDIGHVQPFRTDSRGRFMFRFRNGPGPRRPKDIQPPSCQGGGPVTFEQWRRKAYRSKLIRRTARDRVNGTPPGP
jgi:hypothetical protein